METQFTKGEWRPEVTGGVLRILSFSHKQTADNVALVFMPKYSGVDRYEKAKETAEANAKLIAAAPEMYQALINISKWLADDTQLPTDATMDSVWDAIKKASAPSVWQEIKKTFEL